LDESRAGSVAEEFSTSPGEPNHEDITRTALSFLRPEVLLALQAANVATDGDVLIDESQPFPALEPYSTVPSTGFVIVQGSKPKRAKLDRPKLAPYPRSAVVSVDLGGPPKPGPRARGLISGTVDYEPGDACPTTIAMTHEALNKDKSSLVERSRQYEAAKTLAILQSEHEWCRLRSLTDRAWGPTGTARLDAWVALGTTTPSCDGADSPPAD
jgi:hypothetical protein